MVMYDPLNAKAGLAKRNGSSVRLQLLPHAAVILKLSDKVISGGNYAYEKAAGMPVSVNGNWSIKFISGGPELPAIMTMKSAAPWTTAGDDVANRFSGIGVYTTQFANPGAKTKAYRLTIDSVFATAVIKVNGKVIDTLIGPSFSTTIPASILKSKNTLEISVANLMANRIIWMDQQKMPWKIFYNTNMPARLRDNSVNGLFSAAKWKPLKSGIEGNVTLTPIEYE